MNDLASYVELVVEPTFEDFRRNPLSVRHCYLACVVTFHAIDRAGTKKNAANLRKDWRKASLEFLLVDMAAHHFKHVKSSLERSDLTDPKPYLSDLVFARQGPGVQSLGNETMEIRNFHFVIRDAITFLKKQAMGA